ncbi:MAG TPA: LysR substrate-binding domain-containing protein [Gemmatimonadales bacterium]|nr:LysR substrate-binding domain-containing protein [Gemmatimonadales bacterium]
MRLSQIRDFVAVVESGGIRAAARKLGVSQPAITRSVRSLETELHARLLRRTPTGVVPTQPGRALFARARAAQAELRKAEEEVDQLGQTAESVAFGCSPTSAMMVPEAITRFRTQYPQARLRIAEGLPQALIPMVRDESLDFAICRRALVKLDSGLAFRPLLRNDFVVVVRKGHPLEKAPSLAQLVDASWISLLPLDAPDGPFASAFSPTGLSAPKQVIQCESYNTAIGLIAKSDMVGFLSRQLLSDSILGDFLTEVPVAEPLPSFAVGMFTRTGTPLTQAAAAMAKAVISVAHSRASRLGDAGAAQASGIRGKSK